MIYNIIQSKQYLKVPKFDFSNPSVNPIQLADDVAQSLLKAGGIGLTGNQIGIPYRIFAIAASPMIVGFNPIIVDLSTDSEYLDESTLSVPFLIVKVKRPKTIKVRYTEPNGNVVTTKFSGMTARIFQQLVDQLDGISSLNKATVYHRTQAFSRRKKLIRQMRQNESTS